MFERAAEEMTVKCPAIELVPSRSSTRDKVHLLPNAVDTPSAHMLDIGRSDARAQRKQRKQRKQCSMSSRVRRLRSV